MTLATSGLSGQQRADVQPELLDVEAVARLCGCSAPHVRRLADAGDGCPRTTKGGSR